MFMPTSDASLLAHRALALVLLAGLSTGCGSPTEAGARGSDYAIHVSGLVVASHDGQPVVDAEVRLLHRSWSGSCGFKGGTTCTSSQTLLAKTSADDRGHYQVSGEFRASSCLGVHVHASAPDFVSRELPVLGTHCDGTPASVRIELGPRNHGQ
ncbi:MAG: hypothetical protein EA421_08610 [Gemmatimonadales bacterium]|nr:MAG: hypothetical protein EA421_08610 [Gemmatimonadales bacterium]